MAACKGLGRNAICPQPYPLLQLQVAHGNWLHRRLAPIRRRSSRGHPLRHGGRFSQRYRVATAHVRKRLCDCRECCRSGTSGGGRRRNSGGRLRLSGASGHRSPKRSGGAISRASDSTRLAHLQGEHESSKHRAASLVAETEGFEPSMQVLPAYSLSRGAPSATRSRLLGLRAVILSPALSGTLAARGCSGGAAARHPLPGV